MKPVGEVLRFCDVQSALLRVLTVGKFDDVFVLFCFFLLLLALRDLLVVMDDEVCELPSPVLTPIRGLRPRAWMVSLVSMNELRRDAAVERSPRGAASTPLFCSRELRERRSTRS